MKKIKTLFIFRGLPGNGKTTAAEMMAWQMEHVHGPVRDYKVRSADDYFYENGPNPGVYEFDPAKIGNAHGQCKFKVEADMKKNFTKVFVANTFTTEKELKPYLKMAEEYNYRVVSLIVENRHGNKSIHNVPEETMDKMENRFSIKLR
jgi:hypothetical protein